jgi:two-component system sensor histidine kinase ChvG
VEDRFAQVVRNVLTNAVSFSPPDGVVRIIVRRAATMAFDAGTVQVAIEDDGPGFAPQKIDEAFDRFYSARPKGEAFGQHSGLGLSISRQIIEAHHGRIWAENRVRADGSIAGARVLIRLPLMPLR